MSFPPVRGIAASGTLLDVHELALAAASEPTNVVPIDGGFVVIAQVLHHRGLIHVAWSTGGDDPASIRVERAIVGPYRVDRVDPPRPPTEGVHRASSTFDTVGAEVPGEPMSPPSSHRDERRSRRCTRSSLRSGGA